MFRTLVNSSSALLIIAALLHHICSASPLPSAQPLAHLSGDSIAEAATYLTKYGYVTSSVMAGTQRSSALTSLSESIREFQEFAGLNVTGELDSATLAKMRLPRCGVKDKLGPSYRARRRKRYALQGSRWRTKDLRYKILSWPRSISDKRKVRDVIEKSFQVWQDKSSLTFKRVRPNQAAQIEIRFESGEHGDGDPFDGPGGTLAHAFFPLYGGDAHFDDDERWTTSVGSRGTNLFMTASHEFGHSLGLSHSKTPGALMGPFYQHPPSDGSTNVLKEDDILGIQALYGPPENAVSSEPSAAATTPTTADEEDQQLCSDPAVRVDAMFMAGSQSQTYVFRGSQYWKLTKYGVAEGYPRKIADYWPGIPDDVDAAFSWMPKDRVYFFKGSKYWRMTNFKLDADYPKLISEGFQGIPNDVEACLRWTGNGKLYFFKGTEYWKYDSSRSVPVSDAYPQPISNWRGIPEHLDAALTYSNGFSYFFRKGYYYRFDDASFRVDGGDPPYPRPSGHWWFGCKSQTSSMTSSLSDRDSDPPASSFNGDAVMGFGDVQTSQRESSATVRVPATVLVAVSISFLSRVIAYVFL